MRLEDFKLNEIYLWQDDDSKYLEKVIEIDNQGIKTRLIKKISPDTSPQNIYDIFWTQNELKDFYPLTAIEKIKYL